jgi:hypothetical protein
MWRGQNRAEDGEKEGPSNHRTDDRTTSVVSGSAPEQ